jgi:hypothetical protein
MPEDFDLTQYDDYFETLGEMDLGTVDGRQIKITLFQCVECGSAITARAIHYSMHHKLVLKDQAA